jgi:DNA-binding protein Fis
MPRDIDVIQKDQAELFKSINFFWSQLNDSKKDEIYKLYIEFSENIAIILQPQKEETEGASVKGDEMVGGKRQKTRKKRKSTKGKAKKTRRRS